MSRIIAVAGKGGTGKTTLAALIIRALKEESSGSVLAIDADPNSNLGELLGVKTLSTVVEIVDSISKNPGQIPAGVTKDRYIDMKIQESLDEGEGYDLLSMGRPEGPGCYCFANNMLRDLIKKLMDNFSYVVIDNEAGLEHLSRRLVRTIDRLFIVSDTSVVGMRSAKRISQLADELEITVEERFFVLNKLKGVQENAPDFKIALPFSKELEDASVEGKSIFDLSGENPVLNQIRGIYGNTKRSLASGN